MRAFLWLIAALLLLCAPVQAETAAAILTANATLVEKASRQTIGPVIAALATSGDPTAATVLSAWVGKGLGLRKSDGAFFLISKTADGYALKDLGGADAGTAATADITGLKPNAGVRGLIETALVQFTLSDPDRTKRADALTSIARDPKAELLAPLRASVGTETDATLKAQKERLARLLTLQFDSDSAARVTAITSFGADLGLDIRAALNPILATRRIAVAGAAPPGTNVAADLKPGRDLSEPEAYDILVAAGLAPARLSIEDERKALVANLAGGAVGGVKRADLDTQSARDRAYNALEVAGTVPPAATDDEVKAAVTAHRFYDAYAEPDAAVTSAARAELGKIGLAVSVMQVALSLYLFQNDSGLRGNNGLSGLQNLPGLADVSQDRLSLWFFWASAAALALAYILLSRVISGKSGSVIRAIRDDENRVRFLGYSIESYKLFIFIVTAVTAVTAVTTAIAGALYYPQAGIVNPAELAPIVSIYLAVGVAIGGRGRLYGAVIWAAVVALLSSWFTGGRAPAITLGIYTIDWVDWWQVLPRLAFVAVTLFAPKGIGGVFDRFQGLRTPDRKGAPLGPDDGSFQEKEAVE